MRSRSFLVIVAARVNSARAVHELGHAQVDDDARQRERFAPAQPVLALHEIQHAVDCDSCSLVEVLVEAERQPRVRRPRDGPSKREVLVHGQREPHAIDRRFDRARYDAVQRMTTFLDALRDGRAEPEEVEGVLRELVADPRLELLFFLTASGQYVDTRGVPASDVPDDVRERIAIERGGQPLGIVLLDPPMPEQRDLLRRVVEAGGLAIEMARLRAELRRQLAEVEASRARIVAAGNEGRINDHGLQGYGTIQSPGNSPFVITVGAMRTASTAIRTDDEIATYSSKGPTAIDHIVKPDLVAPGNLLDSSMSDGATLARKHPQNVVDPFTYKSDAKLTTRSNYLTLSGTSMAAPVVSGTVALMLQANPSLTPNQIKAILQYTSEVRASSDPLTQGAGFLNARGAIQLARYLGAPSSIPYPNASSWSGRLIWGNRLVTGGRLTTDGNAWSAAVTWGAPTIADGHSVSWGVRCSTADCTSTAGPWRLSQTYSLNVVWGSVCGGSNCTSPWTIEVATTADEGETVVWGTNDGETVVWGTLDGETVVWGTSCPECTPFVWNRR